MKEQTQRPSVSFADAVAQRHKAVEPGMVAGAFGVPGWVDCASGCLSRVQGCAQVTVGDIMVAASDLAARFNGEIVDFSLRSEGGARVYAFENRFRARRRGVLGDRGVLAYRRRDGERVRGCLRRRLRPGLWARLHAYGGRGVGGGMARQACSLRAPDRVHRSGALVSGLAGMGRWFLRRVAPISATLFPMRNRRTPTS